MYNFLGKKILEQISKELIMAIVMITKLIAIKLVKTRQKITHNKICKEYEAMVNNS